MKQGNGSWLSASDTWSDLVRLGSCSLTPLPPWRCCAVRLQLGVCPCWLASACSSPCGVCVPAPLPLQEAGPDRPALLSLSDSLLRPCWMSLNDGQAGLCLGSTGLKVLEVQAHLSHTLLFAKAPSVGCHLLNTCGTQNIKAVGLLIRGTGRAQKETPQPWRMGWAQMAAQTCACCFKDASCL